MADEKLPAVYRTFVNDFANVAQAHDALGKAIHEAGPLDEKTRYLVKLGISAALQSKGALRAHARRALAAGASVEEVKHAVLLSMTTAGFPGTIASLNYLEQTLDNA